MKSFYQWLYRLATEQGQCSYGQFSMGALARAARQSAEGPGADTTYGGQPAFVVYPHNRRGFIFVGDRWNPQDLHDSRYFCCWAGGPFRNN